MNHNHKSNASMAWMMLPCLLILILGVFVGGSSFRSWLFPALVGLMIATHLAMMLRRHRSPDKKNRHAADMEQASLEKATDTDGKGDNQGSCCH